MNIMDKLNIAVAAICLIYSIFCLIKGKNVKIVCKGTNKVVNIICYLILGVLVFLSSKDILSLICGVIVALSGVLFSLVPSGYDEKGIYINGRLYAFDKITSMDFDCVNDYYQLSFTYQGKCHLLIGSKEDKEKLKGAQVLYNNKKVGI